MKTGIYQLFVYGSLRSGFRNPAYQYLACHFKLLGEAVVQGKLYDKGDYPVAVPSSEDAFITGEISEPQAHYARECGVGYFACGHHASERYGAPAVAGHVAAQLSLEHEFIDIDNPA